MAQPKNIIYGLFDPRTDELRYIGKSTTGIKRAKAHWKPSQLRNPNNRARSKAWVKSLLANGVVPEARILQECLKDNLADAEIYNIAYYRFIGCRLINHAGGGEGALGIKKSPKTIALMKTKVPWNKNRKRQIIDDLGNVYINVDEAALKLDVTPDHIYSVLSGRKPHAGGRALSYLGFSSTLPKLKNKEQISQNASSKSKKMWGNPTTKSKVINSLKEYYKKNPKQFPIVDCATGAAYINCAEAARSLKLNANSIYCVVIGRRKSIFGRMFIKGSNK